MVLVFSTVVNGTFTHSYLFKIDDIIKDNYYGRTVELCKYDYVRLRLRAIQLSISADMPFIEITSPVAVSLTIFSAPGVYYLFSK